MRRFSMTMMAAVAALALSLTATPPARAQVASQPQCTTVDITGMTTMNDCTGEVVTLTSGTMTTCVQAVFDASGGKHAVVHVMEDGIGVSDSGSQYVFHVDALGSIQLPSSSTDVVTALGTAELIGKGSAANEVAGVLLHVTVDANGNPTAEVDKISMHCQG
jgi:hypothetical protein